MRYSLNANASTFGDYTFLYSLFTVTSFTMRFSCLPLLLLLPVYGFAQTSPDNSMQQTTRDRINFSGLKIPANGVLFGVDGPPGQILGDAYLDTTFQAGTIRFYGRIGQSDTLAGVPVRLDLMANEVEIQASPADIRVAKGHSVKRFAMNSKLGGVSHFVNVLEYRGDADAINGFFEQLVTGRVELLLHPFISVKKSTYNPALNTGSKDDQLLKKADWYIGRQGQAVKFSPGKKAVLELMADRKEQVEAYLQAEKPDLKSRAGLVALFTFYNRL